MSDALWINWSSVFGARLGTLLTGLAAIWVGRRVSGNPICHGLLVGVIVAGLPLFVRQRFAIESFLLLAVTLLAGAVGAWLGGQMKGSTGA